MIELENITVGPPARPLLGNVSLKVGSGGHVVLCGPSGAGKTTLLRAIAGLARLEQGSVSIAGTLASDASGERLQPSQRGIGMVFQDFGLWPHLNVAGNVALAVRSSWHSLFKTPLVARKALEECHLAGFEKRRIDSLSGGELQRLALARALAGSPRILLLDEPFTALDMPVRDKLAALIRHLVLDRQMTVVSVLHDPHDALNLNPDRIVAMEAGRIIEEVVPGDVATRPMKSEMLVAWSARLRNNLPSPGLL